MTSDALLILQTIFTSIWSLFTSWYIPGTNVTPALMAVFIMLAAFVLRMIKKYFGGNDEE